MDLLALHIYNLDDDEEADLVCDLLNSAFNKHQWNIERPTNDTNAIFIEIVIPDAPIEQYQVRQLKFTKSLNLLSELDKSMVDSIKSMDLSVSMRIHTDEHYLPIPNEFVSECGRLGINICVLNIGLIHKDVTSGRS